MTTPRLLALSDLHVAHPQNREIVAGMTPGNDDDWLLLAGDVGESYPDIEWALRTLADKYATVVWTPGNHELWTRRQDPVDLRGEQRYLALVELCRKIGIRTPEDPYPVWHGPGGPVTVAPVFLLYDYTFRPDGALTKEQGLKLAYEKGIVCSDEALLHPDPYHAIEEWCSARIEATQKSSQTGTPRSRSSSSRTTRWSASPPGCCAIQCSRSGAAPPEPKTGTCAITPPRSSTATCTSPG